MPFTVTFAQLDSAASKQTTIQFSVTKATIRNAVLYLAHAALSVITAQSKELQK